MQPCRAYWMVGGHPNCGRCVAPACRSPAGRNNAPDRPGYASSLYPGLRVGPLRQPGQPPVFHRAGTGPSGTPLAISGTGKCGARHASATECFCPPRTVPAGSGGWPTPPRRFPHLSRGILLDSIFLFRCPHFGPFPRPCPPLILFSCLPFRGFNLTRSEVSPPWCLMASSCIFKALARSLGRVSSRWLVLSSTICVMACSSVRLRMIHGMSA